MTSAELPGKTSQAWSIGKNMASSSDAPATGKFDAWMLRNSHWIALCIIIVGFAFRLYYCGASYLNPDEAQHFNAARANTWSGAYHESTRIAHPPLLVMLLHALLMLGRSEMLLRLPSLLAGTAALWITFIWLRRSLGEIPALVGLLFLTVSPAAISASTEVRQYGLVLLLVSGALYATERALNEQSSRWAVIQGLCLLVLALTHYTAPVVLASLDLYVVLRCLGHRTPRRLWVIFAVTQVLIALVLLWLYFTNVRKSSLSHVGGLSYLDPFFPAPGETVFAFSARALLATFVHMLNQRQAPLAMLMFAAGIAALAAGRTRAPRLMGLLIIVPFIVGLIIGIVHVFPFAGSRHQTYLLPFVAAGFAAAFTWIPRRFAASALLPLMALGLFFIARNPPDNNPRWMRMSYMTATVDYINQTIPRGAPLFVDQQTGFVLGYYLGRNESSLDVPQAIWNNPTLGGHPLVASRDWLFDPNDAISQANKLADGVGLPVGDPLWIVSVAWLDDPLDQRLHTGTPFHSNDFGTNAIIEITHQ